MSPKIASLTSLACVLLVSGCSVLQGGSAGADKAGGQVPPLVLRAWSSEAADRPSGAQLGAFVAAVDRISNARIRIEPTYGAAVVDADADESVIQSVSDGTYPLGLAATRAFPSVGVESFRALTAPFVIQTDAVAAAVAGDAALTDPMLDGLHAVGLTGLALIPESIRHPFGVTSPVLGPDDYRGAAVRSLRSSETYAIFAALGARPGNWEGAALDAGLRDGSIDLVESSFAIANGVTSIPMIGTGNVDLFPRMNALFANSSALGRLTAEQQHVLAAAAAEAREASIAAVTPDAEAAEAYCRNGGQVVLATDTQLEELHAAVRPYLAGLKQDPGTRSVLTTISALAARTPEPSPPLACGPGPLESSGVLQPWPTSDSDSPLDGVYRVEITDADLRSVGVSDVELPELHGTFTWTIANGMMSFDRVAPNPQNQIHEDWHLVVRGSEAMLVDTAPEAERTAANVLWKGTWSVDDNGDLRLSNYVPGQSSAAFDRVWWFSKPFTRLH